MAASVWIIFIFGTQVLAHLYALPAENRTLHDVAQNILGKKICMDELGCFELDKEFFDIRYRPVNVLPQNRDIINTRFYLYTKERPSEKHVLRANHLDTIESSTFNASRDTKVIIHGLLDSQVIGRWMEDMKTAFLVHGDYNVIIVDWSDGNGFPYTQATANTRVVAAELALLIEYLEKTRGLKPEMCHLIGHSLGAHIAGYTGKRIKEKGGLIGRVTGLDPAEPYFQNMPPKVRIDRTDADFVDIIHSDTDPILVMGLGMSQPVGHLDFFPNDGRKHPGCTGTIAKTFVVEGFNEGMRRLVSCEHQRSVDFFHTSIVLGDCQMVGYRCPSWDFFSKGKCYECGPKGDRCAVMGIKAIEFKKFIEEDKSINMYLKTSGEKPFCVFAYQVLIHLANPKGAKEQKGTITLTLHGQGGNQYKEKLDASDVSYYPGSQYTYLVTTPEKLGTVEKVTFTWKAAFNPLNLITKPKLYLKKIRIIPIYLTDSEARTKGTSWICGSLSDAVKTKESLILRHDLKCKDA